MAYDSEASSEDSNASEESEKTEDDDSDKSSDDNRNKRSTAKKRTNVKVVKVSEPAGQIESRPSTSRQTRMQLRLQENTDFLPQSDNYFSTHSKKKVNQNNNAF